MATTIEVTSGGNKAAAVDASVTDSKSTELSSMSSKQLRISGKKNRTDDSIECNDFCDDDFDLLLTEVRTIEDRWSPQPSWSIAQGPHDSKVDADPLLTSTECYLGLVDFFHRKSRKEVPKLNATHWLAVATESSSHVSGRYSLDALPWVYAGGGLGNVDECLYLNTYFPNDDPLVHVCLAGGTSRDSLTFASVCVPSECTAKDLFADDFAERVQSAGFKALSPPGTQRVATKDEQVYGDLLHEYVQLHRNIANVGNYLGTGWVCGEYSVEWEPIPSMLWCAIMVACAAFTILRTCVWNTNRHSLSNRKSSKNTIDWQVPQVNGNRCCSEPEADCQGTKRLESFLSAWDASIHIRNLRTRHTNATACLDGLRVGSILWIIGAHVMAIQSSTGPGYLNPVSFLPPHGFTTTLFGQLLFSSRFAVDTFLCISGYLAAYVLQRKLSETRDIGLIQILWICGLRMLRILPLYICCLGFWMFLAPHLGHGPFWYQWEHFLEPCKQLWWTNLLFVNNFLPWGAPTEANCFYHSWYLAVDVQLFCLFAPWLVLCYKKSARLSQQITIGLWITSVIATAALAFTQEWSVNSFDGISVALFDVEGYAKPHVRAQSYLAGMFVAFHPRLSSRSSKHQSISMMIALGGLGVLSFVTVTGAYARRACTFQESPLEGDDCGSSWKPSTILAYAAFSRAIWSLCIALLLHLCLGNEDTNENGSTANQFSIVQSVKGILGWSFWTPLAQLSFGAYLIHPIVIYIWFLGGREKIFFRVSTYFMEFCSITVVTFGISFVLTVLVEFPFGKLLRPTARPIRSSSNQIETNGGRFVVDCCESESLLQASLSSSSMEHSDYGSRRTQ